MNAVGRIEDVQVHDKYGVTWWASLAPGRSSSNGSKELVMHRNDELIPHKASRIRSTTSSKANP